MTNRACGVRILLSFFIALVLQLELTGRSASADDSSESLKIYQTEFHQAIREFNSSNYDSAYDHFMKSGDAIEPQNKKFAAFSHLMAMDVLRVKLSLHQLNSNQIINAMAYIDSEIIPNINRAESRDLWGKAKFYSGVFRIFLKDAEARDVSNTRDDGIFSEMMVARTEFIDALDCISKKDNPLLWSMIAYQLVGIESVLGVYFKDRSELLHAKSLSEDLLTYYSGVGDDGKAQQVRSRLAEIDKNLKQFQN